MLYQLIKELSPEWQQIFLKFEHTDWFKQLNEFLSTADFSEILPAKQNILKAFTFVNPLDIKVIILGQDPYINREQATGLAFAVPVGVSRPPSLQNIFDEVIHDYGEVLTTSDLCSWAEQGVLLLNATLTVSVGKSNSHAHLPWRTLVVNVLNEIVKKNDICGMLLWGSFAKKIHDEMPIKAFYSLTSSHPSPLSYYISFRECHHFKSINEYLKMRKVATIQW